MDLIRAKAALARLLGCNVDIMPFCDLKTLIRKRKLAWHPDKNVDKDNPNEFAELFRELIEAWDIYCKYNAPSTSSTQGSFSDDPGFDFRKFTQSKPDLYCDESMPSSDDESEPCRSQKTFKKKSQSSKASKNQSSNSDSDFEMRNSREGTPEYNDTPFDDDFFIPSPKKKFAIPDDMRAYFRSITNRRAGKCFIIFSLAKNAKIAKDVYWRYFGQTAYFGIYSVRTDKDLCMIVMMLNSETRLADIKKECRKVKLSPFDAFYGTKIGKCVEFCHEKYGDPLEEPCKLTKSSTPDGSKKLNYKLISDFAISYEINDCYTLMYEYAHLASGCDRDPNLITPEHESDHSEHLENAKIFVHLSDQKRCAKNAVDTVFARLYTQLQRETNIDFLNRRSREIGSYIIDNYSAEEIGRAWFYCNDVVPNFEVIARRILNTFTVGKPRRRYICLQGVYKSGKTSFASAFLKLFDGVSINVNVDQSRLPFYLGNAIGKRYVLFDDVKGRSFSSENLSCGSGFANLDNLRDHIDGHVEVQLEKKNQQPVNQIFPAGLITCNHYHIPQSLRERIIGPIEFKASNSFKIHPPKIITKETIYIGLVLKNLLPAEPHVFEKIFIAKGEFEKQCITSNCKCYQMYKQRQVSNLIISLF